MPMESMSFTTTNRHGYSVKFSPFDADLLVVASSQYFGLCGAGTLYLLEVTNEGLHEVGEVHWSDGLFDVVWADSNEEIVATSSGDGSIQLWNLHSLETGSPFLHFAAHGGEIYSIDWGSNSLHGKQFLSASWDRTVKLWDSNTFKLTSTFSAHTDVIFDACFSNSLPSVFSSVAADGSLILWNSSSPKPFAKVSAHDGEVLTCAWNNFNSNVMATGGSDNMVHGWDLRNLSTNIFELAGCEYAVRRICFSPHTENVLVSAAYDFSTRIWNYREMSGPLESIVQHSEFVYGLDWSPHKVEQIADCGWDSLVCVFAPNSVDDI